MIDSLLFFAKLRTNDAKFSVLRQPRAHHDRACRAGGAELFRMPESLGCAGAVLGCEPEAGEESLGGLGEKVNVASSALPSECERIGCQPLPEPRPALGRRYDERTQ